VNGYGIRAVGSRFGRIFVVDGLGKGALTLEGAEELAREAKPEDFKMSGIVAVVMGFCLAVPPAECTNLPSCLDLTHPCTMERTISPRVYMIFHDETLHEAELCDLMEEARPQPSRKINMFYKCLKDFTPAPGDREMANLLELAPRLIPLILQRYHADPERFKALLERCSEEDNCAEVFRREYGDQ
jgi:hypothetical protein